MKNIGLIFIIFGMTMQLSSQNYINTIIPFDVANPNPLKLSKEEDRFIIKVIHNFGINNLGSTSFVILDQSLLVSEVEISEGLLLTRHSPFLHNGYYFGFGDNFIDVTSLDFVKYDQNFNLLNSFDFNTPNGNSGGTSSTFIDGYLYGASVDDYNRGTDDYQRQSTLFKFDTLGEKLWSVNMGQADRNTYIWDLDHSLDDHLLISSMVYSEDRKPLTQLTKMDADHQVVWNTRTEDEINCCAVPAWITTLSDSSIVQTYALDKRQNLEWQTAREHYPFPPKLLWYNKDGNTYQDTLIRSPYFDQTRINQIKSGRGDYFFGYGDYNKDSDVDDETFWGWLFKMSNSGEMIWSKRYRHPDYLTSEGQHTINDIVELDNGDIVILGRLNNIGGPSEIWLLKVNEHGCYGDVTCGEEVITSSRDVGTDKNRIHIYPNPSDGKFYLSMDYTPHTIRVEVYDMQGQLVLKTDGIDIDFIDLTRHQSGVYQLKIILDNNKVVNARVIKQ